MEVQVFEQLTTLQSLILNLEKKKKKDAKHFLVFFVFVFFEVLLFFLFVLFQVIIVINYKQNYPHMNSKSLQCLTSNKHS